jgi:hypothetical protein
MKYFVHVVGPDGAMLGQEDGPLGRWPDDADTGWSSETLLRQRVRVSLAWADRNRPYTLLTGLYDPQDGQRLPLTINGRRVDGDRYQVPPGR